MYKYLTPLATKANIINDDHHMCDVRERSESAQQIYQPGSLTCTVVFTGTCTTASFVASLGPLYYPRTTQTYDTRLLHNLITNRLIFNVT